MTRLAFLCLPMAALAAAPFAEPAPPVDAEVCVYGGTPSGVMAAVAAARNGHTVSLVDINAHMGGGVSGGLVATDMGDREPVGGLTIRHATGTTKLTVNERDETTPFNFTPVGEFSFNAGTSGFVEITSANTDGRVVIDGVRWVWLGE